MKTCKVKPPYYICKGCIDIHDSYGMIEDCDLCKQNSPIYELVSVGSNFWGDYAMIQKDGLIEKVSLNRIYDLKEA